MYRKSSRTMTLIAAPLLLIGTAALSGEGVEFNVTNDGTEDLVVTVYDTSTRPSSVVLSNARITGFTSVPVSVSPDASGRANVSWTAVNTDAKFRRCGHGENVGVGSASTLSVHADSSCTSG